MLHILTLHFMLSLAYQYFICRSVCVFFPGLNQIQSPEAHMEQQSKWASTLSSMKKTGEHHMYTGASHTYSKPLLSRHCYCCCCCCYTSLLLEHFCHVRQHCLFSKLWKILWHLWPTRLLNILCPGILLRCVYFPVCKTVTHLNTDAHLSLLLHLYP